MIIEIIDDETIEVYGETAELADKNAKKFIKIALGNERWSSYSSQCGTVMDKAKLYKVIIRLTKDACRKLLKTTHNSDYAKCADEICRYLQSELYVMEQDTAVIEILRKHFA